MNGTFVDLDMVFYLILLVGAMVALYWLATGEDSTPKGGRLNGGLGTNLKGAMMEIFHVYHEEDHVGRFLQASFSTKEKADYYVKNNKHGYPEHEMSVVPYILDSAEHNVELTGGCAPRKENEAMNDETQTPSTTPDGAASELSDGFGIWEQ